MENKFSKNLATVVTSDGQHLLCDKNGVIRGQLKSLVVDEIEQQPIARVTLQVNICSSLDEALKKYNDEQKN